MIEYLAAKAWDVTSQSSDELHAANGFELPDNEIVAALRGSMSYIRAELR